MTGRSLAGLALLAGAALLACGQREATVSAPAAPAAPASAPASPIAPASAVASALPAEVAAFREKRDACDHFRGEEPYDAQRAAFLKAELARTCTGTDAALDALRRRYAGDAQVLAALKDYEDKIE